MSEAEVHVTAADAARRLDVSGTGLRRLADIYDRVYQPLERDPKTNNRFWTLSAVEHLEQARALLRAGRAASIEAALIALGEGAQPAADDLSTPAAGLSRNAALDMLAERFAALERDNKEMKAVLQQLLENQQTTVNLIEVGQDGRERVVELERTNGYLLGELQRRRLEVEAQEARRHRWRWPWQRRS